MTNIKDLLKYKTDIGLTNKHGEVIKTVWVRLIGDEDLNKAARLARIASTKMRLALRNPESEEYQDQIAPVAELDRTSLEAIVVGSLQNQFTSEAYVKINREELPKMEDFAVEPDAPQLEEQEELDKATLQQQEEYEKKIEEYIQDRVAGLRGELSEMTLEQVIEKARFEMSNILPLQTFFDELNMQKLLRGTYDDKLCKVLSFSLIDDVRDTDETLRMQLLAKYNELEISPDTLKN